MHKALGVSALKGEVSAEAPPGGGGDRWQDPGQGNPDLEGVFPTSIPSAIRGVEASGRQSWA